MPDAESEQQLGKWGQMQSALELLREIKATPLKSVRGMRLAEFAVSGRSVHVWSDVLGEEVVFAADNAEVSETSGLVVYRAQELMTLLDVTPNGLRLLHGVKKVFGGEVMSDRQTGREV